MAVNVPDYAAWQKSRKAVPFSNRHSYFEIPIFVGTPEFARFSNVIPPQIGSCQSLLVQYNFTASQHFIITELPTKPAGANFIPCIKYTLSGGTVVRYKLWTDTLDYIIGHASLYAGQKIYKNFILEIWNLLTMLDVSNPTTIKVPISILQYVTDLNVQTDIKDSTGVECIKLTTTNGLVLPLLYTACNTGTLN